MSNINDGADYKKPRAWIARVSIKNNSALYRAPFHKGLRLIVYDGYQS